MGITAVGSTTQYSGLKSNEDSEIAVLEKSKSRLNEQIEKMKESKLDAKTKQERIKVLQDEIQQIDSAIQQKKLDKVRQKDSTPSVSSPNMSETNNGQLAAADTLVEISTSYNHLKAMNSVENTLKGETRVLAGEIALDQSRGGSSAAVDKKREKLDDLKDTQQDLNQKIGEKSSEVNGELNDLASEQNKSEKADNEEAASETDKNGTEDQNRRSVNHKKTTTENITVSKKIDLYL